MDVSVHDAAVSLEQCSEELQRKNLAVAGLTMLFEHMVYKGLANTRDYNTIQVHRSGYTGDYNTLQVWLTPGTTTPYRYTGLANTGTTTPYRYKGLANTRDYNTLQEALNNLEDYDKTCLEAALHGVSNVVQQEWGHACPTQVVLVTDGSLGIGKGSLRHSLQTLKGRPEDKKFPLPFPFPAKLFIMCIANAEELQMTDTMHNLEQLLQLNGGDGQIFTMEGQLCLKSVQVMFGCVCQPRSFRPTLHVYFSGWKLNLKLVETTQAPGPFSGT
ncbi:integrator complex subunit 14-like [Oncorhynchus nerka]|uniref:integrator complex subunit 14-like n=1 Tax=Oncorhynchus nerka TaxID=8023 RepID=UPI0031B89C60